MRLKELRTEKNLTQEEVAKEIGTSQTNIGRWEKGLNEPSSSFVVKLANFFEVSTDYLLGRSDDFGNVTVTTASSSAVLPPDEQELLELYKKLPKTRQKTVLDTIRFMSESSEAADKSSKEKFYGTK